MRPRLYRLGLLLASALLVIAPQLTRADDTDIYFGSANQNSAPYVMLYIDYRASTGNNGQVSCTGFAAGTQHMVDTDGNGTLDTWDGTYDNEGCLHYFTRQLPNEFCATTALTGANVCTSSETNQGKIGAISPYLTYLRLSLVLALTHFEGKGIKVGLMVSQNADNSSGDGNTATNSSNGGMITLGFNPLASNAYIPTSLTNGTNVTVTQAISAQLKATARYFSDSNYGAYSTPNQLAQVFFEFYRYLHGGGVWNGHNGYTTWDSNKGGIGTSNVRPEHCTNYADPFGAAYGLTAGSGNSYVNNRSAMCWDNTIENPTNQGAPTTATYIAPLGQNPLCTTITTINFTNGAINQDDDSNAKIAQSVANGGMAITPGSNASVEVVRALNRAATDHPDYNIPSVKSYFIGSNQANVLPQLAAAGGTGNFINIQSSDPAQDPGGLVKNIENVLQQVLSVSTTFVATAVPVNAFNRSQVLDNAFLALFKPSPAGLQFWNGDLKKLKLQNGQFVDALGQSASQVISTDGRIAPGALSFWTNRGALPASGFDATEATATTDGRAVDRGGAGQLIPGFMSGSPGDTNGGTNRNVYWDNGASIATLNSATTTDANGANNAALQTALGMSAGCTIGSSTSTTIQQCTQQMLRWIRGQNAGAPPPGAWNATNTAPYGPRPWLVGDPLHARPLPLNFGAFSCASPCSGLGTFTTNNPGIFIAMGGNDGQLHFFQNTTSAGAESGKELWTFIPKAMMNIQKTLAFNQPTSPTAHGPYGMDGTPVAMVNDNDGDGTVEPGGTQNDTVTLLMNMRRGGKRIYALDVTNPTSPAFKWWNSGGNTSADGVCNSSGCPVSDTNTDFAEQGLTFSTVSTGTVTINGTDTKVLIYGGGYDPNKDRVPGNSNVLKVGSDDSVGNAIFIVKASDGTLIWKAIRGNATGPASGSNTNTIFRHVNLKDSIPSQVAAVDTSGDGRIDRIIVGDTGGNVWRVDIPDDNRGHWALTQIAKLGRWYADSAGQPTNKVSDRRFFYPPDIVQTLDSTGAAFDAYPLGSGDREDPLDKEAGNGVSGQPPDVTQNWFYMLRDNCTEVLSWSDISGGSPPPCVSRYPITHSQLDDITHTCLSANSTCTVTNALAYGWKLQLTKPRGEKALAKAETVNGVIYFTTYVPNDPTAQQNGNSCGVPKEGNGYSYAVSLANGSASYAGGDWRSTGSPSTEGDRSTQLSSGGIPAETQILPTATGTIALTGDLCQGACGSVTGLSPKPTFWRRVEEAPP